ncbi:hypothetical protein BCR42DRAFT_87524 [Absidia repens]|uniref:Cyclin N-terminal domain-containing protein n=1 Tax=Absidia repens TaxID=90262 RepID=A0A1X2IZU9_9FUNG|nr:hypothetical protein BCR42DRAFT_87524 [Absidia repens]
MKIGVRIHKYRSKGRIDTYQIHKSPYTTDYRQACQILDVIQHHHQRPSQACLVRLATFVAQSWESAPTDETIRNISHFMDNLLDTTGTDPTIPLNESILQSCSGQSPVPTVCPGITLLFAVQYIERLKQNYTDIKGAHGCSRRLVLVAYIIAAKYIQSNLKLIADTGRPSLKTYSPSSPKHLPTVPTAMPISPPVSPKVPELTDPTQYHYFQSANKPTTVSSQPPNNMPSFSSMCSQFNYRIWRMENEFLHFLDGDLHVPDCLRLIHWSNQLSSSPSPTCLLPDMI